MRTHYNVLGLVLALEGKKIFFAKCCQPLLDTIKLSHEWALSKGNCITLQVYPKYSLMANDQKSVHFLHFLLLKPLAGETRFFGELFFLRKRNNALVKTKEKPLIWVGPMKGVSG